MSTVCVCVCVCVCVRQYVCVCVCVCVCVARMNLKYTQCWHISIIHVSVHSILCQWQCYTQAQAHTHPKTIWRWWTNRAKSGYCQTFFVWTEFGSRESMSHLYLKLGPVTYHITGKCKQQSLVHNGHPSSWWPCSIVLKHSFQKLVLLLCTTDSP